MQSTPRPPSPAPSPSNHGFAAVPTFGEKKELPVTSIYLQRFGGRSKGGEDGGAIKVKLGEPFRTIPPAVVEL